MRTRGPSLLFVLLLAVGLWSPAGCEDRKKRCEALFQKIAACAPAGQKVSARARRDFVDRCQKEYDGAHVKRARECVKRHADCAARRKCLLQKLKLER